MYLHHCHLAGYNYLLFRLVFACWLFWKFLDSTRAVARHNQWPSILAAPSAFDNSTELLRTFYRTTPFAEYPLPNIVKIDYWLLLLLTKPFNTDVGNEHMSIACFISRRDVPIFPRGSPLYSINIIITSIHVIHTQVPLARGLQRYLSVISFYLTRLCAPLMACTSCSYFPIKVILFKKSRIDVGSYCIGVLRFYCNSFPHINWILCPLDDAHRIEFFASFVDPKFVYESQL